MHKMLDWLRIIHRRQNIHMYHTCLDLAVLNQKVISFSGKNTTSSWILQKEKAGISYHLCVCVWVRFCSRREAACQDERTGIYRRDLNFKRAPFFQLISAFPPFFCPLFRQTDSILGLKVIQHCSEVCECVCVCVLCLFVCFGRAAGLS